MNENQFEKLTQELENIAVPKEKLSNARHQGYRQYQRNQKKKIKTFKKVITVAVILFVFIISVRVSPAFAQTIAKIPGFAPLVEMITHDKGAKDILDNKYYEELGIVQTKNGLTLTILGTVADESGMIIFYQLEAPYDISELEMEEFRLTQNGKETEASRSFSWAAKDPTKIIKEKLEIVASTKMNYSNPNFEVYLAFGDPKRTTFTIPFTLTKPIEPTKLYEVNQTLDINGQTIHVESLSISPLRAEIKLTADPQNTMQILQIDEVKVFDENGEEWGKMNNGIVGFGGFREETNSIFIESNYFRKPKSLTLELNKVEALPKGQDYVEIDFLKQEIVKMPDLKDFNLSIRGKDTIDILYKGSPSHHKQLLSEVIDANGQQFYSNGHSSTSSETGIYESTYTFDLEGAVNPVKIYFWSYPSYLKGSAKLEIPLKD